MIPSKTTSTSGLALLIFLTCLFLLASAILPAGCGRSPVLQEGQEFPMTVYDDMGRLVVVESEPKRIVSLAPANTEILFSLGLSDRLAGVTDYCDYPPEAMAKPKMGGFATPSNELVVAAQPDLVLAAVMQEDHVRQLEEAGLTVVALETTSLQGVLEKIRLVGRITGQSETAMSLTKEMQRRVDLVNAKVGGLSEDERPRVFFEIWPDPLTTGGANSFLNSLIVAAGGINIAGDVERDWLTFSHEALLARDPEVIIFSHHGDSRQTEKDIKARRGWEQVSAIKNDRISHMEDQNLVVRAGPRVVEGLEQIAVMIHPELFK